MTSRRTCGGVASRPSGAGAVVKSSACRIAAARSIGISVPSRADSLRERSRIGAGSGPGPPTSIVPPTGVAPQSSTISCDATACASSVSRALRPFSKRELASERRLSLFDVRLMFGPSQLAASISTRVVDSETSERWPPITPAIDVGPCASSITTTSGSSVRSMSSSVVIRSPSCAWRTTSVPPSTRSQSNACSGCAVSSIT